MFALSQSPHQIHARRLQNSSDIYQARAWQARHANLHTLQSCTPSLVGKLTMKPHTGSSALRAGLFVWSAAGERNGTAHGRNSGPRRTLVYICQRKNGPTRRIAGGSIPAARRRSWQPRQPAPTAPSGRMCRASDWLGGSCARVYLPWLRLVDTCGGTYRRRVDTG